MSDAPLAGKPSAEDRKDERMWGMLCHLSSLAGYVLVPTIGHVLGPLLVWVLKKDEYAFVDDQGKEALNFQLSVTIYILVCAATIIGIPLSIVAIVFGLVMTVVGAVKANAGEYYRYPLTIRLVK